MYPQDAHPAGGEEDAPRGAGSRGGESEGFELEEAAPEPPPPSLPPAARDEAEGARPAREASGAGGETEIDERTVAERRGRARTHGVRRLPPPPGWPGEVLRFPLQKPGPAIVIVGALVYFALDLGMLVLEGGAFLFLVLKALGVLGVLLRGQLGIATRTAAGADLPQGWRTGMDLDEQELRRHAFFILLLGALSLPGVVVWWLLERTGMAVALLLLASSYATVCAVGITVGDARLKLPWRAVRWLLRHPLACVAGSIGWWCIALSEKVVGGLADEGLGIALFASLLLRLAAMYALLFSARVIGVLARRWVP